MVKKEDVFLSILEDIREIEIICKAYDVDSLQYDEDGSMFDLRLLLFLCAFGRKK